MKQLFTLILLFSLFHGTCATAQKSLNTPEQSLPAYSFSATLGVGLSGIFPERQAGPTTLVELAVHRRFGSRFSVVAGLGSQYVNFTDRSLAYDCPPVVGDKILRFETGESFETRRIDITAQLGMVYRVFGQLKISLAAVPALRVSDRLTLTKVVDFANPDYPNRITAYTLQAGQEYGITNNSPVWERGRLSYDKQLQWRADLAISYPVSTRIDLGLRARQGITTDRLTHNRSITSCGVAGCNNIEFESQNVELQDFQLLLTSRFKL